MDVARKFNGIGMDVVRTAAATSPMIQIAFVVRTVARKIGLIQQTLTCGLAQSVVKTGMVRLLRHDAEDGVPSMFTNVPMMQ